MTDPAIPVVKLGEIGQFLGGRPLAAALRSRLTSLAQHSHVVVDLEGIQAMSPSFADELFAKLEPTLRARVELQHARPDLVSMVDVMVARRDPPAGS